MASRPRSSATTTSSTRWKRASARFKLLLTQTDKAEPARPGSAEAAARQSTPCASSRTSSFFEELVAGAGRDLDAHCAMVLPSSSIVDIALSRDQDNPQLIFESMNSTGRELSQADLIRNFILMGLEPSYQTQLYEDHWRPMEVDFGQEAYGTHFDSFMRHYLTVKTGEIPNVSDVYEAFKDARPRAGSGSRRRRCAGGGHPRLRRLLLRYGARQGAGQGSG